MPDAIHIEELELLTYIGVPDAERAAKQRLTVSITLEPSRSLANMQDNLAKTIDYFSVTRSVQALATAHPRQLIETLAEEIATLLLTRYPITHVQIELRKYILPETRYVSVRLARSA